MSGGALRFLAILGASCPEGPGRGPSGDVRAFDVRTGKLRWRFHTVPSPEEGGWWGRLSLTTPEGDRLPRDTAEERRDSATTHPGTCR